MISALICLSLLAPQGDVDSLLKSLEEARKLGLPVTAEERVGPPPTPRVVANQKLVDAFGTINGKNTLSVDLTKGSKMLVAQKGWKESITLVDRLAKSSENLYKFSGSAFSFPQTSRLKTMVRMELVEAIYSSQKKDYPTVTTRLISARRLLDNPVWNQNFIALMSVRAMEEILIDTLGKIKLANKVQFKKLPPTLFAPFQTQKFNNILRSDFADILTLIGGKETLTSDTLPKDPQTLKTLSVMLKNWIVLYPEIRGAISWTNLQTAYLNIEPELEKISVGGEPVTFCPDYLTGTGTIDEKQIEHSHKLQALQRQ